MPLAGHRLRLTALRQPVGRPQLKRDPLGSDWQGCASLGGAMATTYHFSTARIVVFYISAFICGIAVGLAVAGSESPLGALLLVLSQLILTDLLLHTSRHTPTIDVPTG